MILREAMPAVILDDALLSMSTFPNGCDFRLRFEGKRKFVEFGCYGVHRNLVTGNRRFLYLLLDESGGGLELLDVQPETIMQLLKREPCTVCGGFLHKDT